MKRRSFLKSMAAGVAAIFVAKKVAELPDEPITFQGESVVRDESMPSDVYGVGPGPRAMRHYRTSLPSGTWRKLHEGVLPQHNEILHDLRFKEI